MSKIATFVKHPIVSVKSKISDYKQKRITYYLKPENFEKLSDKKAIRLRYYWNMGEYPNLKNPQTFNEKLQWLKLYDRNPKYTKLVDKYEVKKIVADIIGEEYIIPTLGVWNNTDEIDFDSLPDKFVLKCTHDSESVIICKDKSEFDINSAKEKLNSCLKNSLYIWGREWPYKNVKPRIIAEEYLEDENSDSLNDYKFYCFDGKFKTLLIVSERFENGAKLDYFDTDGKHLDIRLSPYPNADVPPALPKNFELMKELSEKLSVGFPHIRPDFYECNGKVYFGELTFFTTAGFSPLEPDVWNYKFGSWIKLPKKKIRN